MFKTECEVQDIELKDQESCLPFYSDCLPLRNKFLGFFDPVILIIVHAPYISLDEHAFWDFNSVNGTAFHALARNHPKKIVTIRKITYQKNVIVNCE